MWAWWAGLSFRLRAFPEPVMLQKGFGKSFFFKSNQRYKIHKLLLHLTEKQHSNTCLKFKLECVLKRNQQKIKMLTDDVSIIPYFQHILEQPFIIMFHVLKT